MPNFPYYLLSSVLKMAQKSFYIFLKMYEQKEQILWF